MGAPKLSYSPLPQYAERSWSCEEIEIGEIMIVNSWPHVERYSLNDILVEEVEYRGVRYIAGTPVKVVAVLDRSRYEGWRLHLYFGDQESGKMCGCSSGMVARKPGYPPLLLRSEGPNGSDIIDTRKIVKIELSNSGKGLVLWKHRYYTDPFSPFPYPLWKEHKRRLRLC